MRTIPYIPTLYATCWKARGSNASAPSLVGALGKYLPRCKKTNVVLADLRLHDEDGIILLEELRKQGKNNPYIVMIDYDEVPTVVRSKKLGAED